MSAKSSAAAKSSRLRPWTTSISWRPVRSAPTKAEKRISASVSQNQSDDTAE